MAFLYKCKSAPICTQLSWCCGTESMPPIKFSSSPGISSSITFESSTLPSPSLCSSLNMTMTASDLCSFAPVISSKINMWSIGISSWKGMLPDTCCYFRLLRKAFKSNYEVSPPLRLLNITIHVYTMSHSFLPSPIAGLVLIVGA